jgi:hypothetical protein
VTSTPITGATANNVLGDNLNNNVTGSVVNKRQHRRRRANQHRDPACRYR